MCWWGLLMQTARAVCTPTSNADTSDVVVWCGHDGGVLLQVVKNEGFKSLFKGAGANILRAVAGAGVLSGYDQLQVIMFGKL